MQLAEALKRNVCFIGCKMEGEGTFRIFGTGFYVGKRLTASAGSMLGYIVTAKHVIDGLHKKGVKTPLVRQNLKSGSFAWFETDIDDWFHNKADPHLDICATVFGESQDMDYTPFDISDKENLQVSNEVLGKTVYFPGFFSQRPGKTRNIPILRSGTVAALPEEKVDTKVGPINAYLIEARSIGGLSGSPVFVEDTNRVKLLGIVHGHYERRAANDHQVREADEHLTYGIAIVIPGADLTRFFEGPSTRFSS